MTNPQPLNQHPSPESLILQARQMQAETIALGLRFMARAIKGIAHEIVDAHRRRALMLQLASMDETRLKDIGVLPGGIEDFVKALDRKVLARRTANDRMIPGAHAA